MLLCSLRPPPLQTETVREKVITFWKAFPFGLEDQLLPRPHPLSPSMQFAKKESKSDSVVARRGEPAPSTRASRERSPWWEGRGHRGEQKGRGPTATLLPCVFLCVPPTHPEEGTVRKIISRVTVAVAIVTLLDTVVVNRLRRLAAEAAKRLLLLPVSDAESDRIRVE